MLTALGLMLAAVGVGFGGYMYFLSGSLAPTPAASLATAAPPVAEASKEPVAAFGPWQSTRPRAAAEAIEEPEVAPAKEPAVSPAKAGVQAAEQKAPAALNTPRPIAPPPTATAITEPAPAPAPAPGPAPAPAGSGITVPPSMAEAPKHAATVPTVPQASPPRAETRRTAPPAAAAPKAQPARKAQLVLAISPGGEVYINGEHQGTTPETTTFDLEPGMYQVEIRSGSRKPYLTYVTVEPGDQRRIRHDFNAKPSRPPT